MGNAMKFTRLLFCAGALVLISAPGASAATAYAITNVNLRAGPATSNEIVGRIPGGAKVETTDCKDGWCAVDWNGKSGFAIQTALDTSGRPPARRAARAYSAGPGYAGPEYAGPEYAEGPPVYYAPGPYYGPPAVYYGGPYWRGGWGWGWGWRGGWRRY